MTGNAYLSQLKILYVEDDIDARENLKQFLRKKAGKVVTAADGEEGLKKYDEERPDIVIADILLPGINGIDMLRRIRESGGKCPFIITSSVDKSEMIIEAVDIGIVKYAVKPIILDQLLDTLNKLAENIGNGNAVFDDVEKKLELENVIKKEMTAFLKKTVGKGPRDLTVFISDDAVEITAYGMLTPLEKKLLEDRHNVAMVENIHAAYYKTVRHELGHIVGSVVSMDAELTRSEFSPFREMDRITFALS